MTRASTARAARKPAQEEHDAQEAGEDYDRETGEVHEVASADNILARVNVPELRTETADLPLLGWTDTAEVEGGDLTSVGFAKLVPGFEFTGFVVGRITVDSEFDSAAGKKKQECYQLFGTARLPVQGADKGAYSSLKGTMTIPTYARLVEAIEANEKGEKQVGKRIPVRIKYEGQGQNRTDPGGKVLRSGAHLFSVVRVQEVTAKKR